MDALFAGLILAATLALILVRPRDVNEAWWATLGGGLTLALGLVSLGEAEAIVLEIRDALFLLVGMMALSAVAEEAGFFQWAARMAARTGRGRVWKLHSMVFLIGTLITAFLSLDATAIVLTPIVYDMVVRMRLSPLPFMFACAYTANTASLFLPISNLTNLLFYNAFNLGFLRFGLVMFVPASLAIVANFLVFAVVFRRELRGSYESKSQPFFPENRAFFRLAIGGIAGVLVAFFLAPLFGVPIGLVALIGGTLTAAWARLRGWIEVREVVRSVSWGLVPLVIGLFLVVEATENAGLAAAVRESFLAAAPGDGLLQILGVAAGSALGSNLVNNLPMSIMALNGISAPLGDGSLDPAVVYATLIGTNVGPNLTVVGSLATLIWLSVVRGRGMEITAKDYLKIGAISMPPILLAAVFGLWVSLQLFGV